MKCPRGQLFATREMVCRRHLRAEGFGGWMKESQRESLMHADAGEGFLLRNGKKGQGCPMGTTIALSDF